MNSVNISKLIIIFLFIAMGNVVAQDQVSRSNNGKSLPVKGTLRVLVIFAEIDYDSNSLINPDVNPDGSDGWKKGELPKWKDDLLDPNIMEQPHGALTKYFWEMSFGTYNVLGDYFKDVITVKQSDLNDVRPFTLVNQQVFKQISEEGELRTRMGFGIDDFDLWTVSGNGHEKYSPSRDQPSKIDHVMVIYRNIISVPTDNGRASPGSPGSICGYSCDSYSVFGGSNHMPFNISKHEYAHLLLGDNNFHVGGGQSGGPNYFISTQGGWSLLGAANSSLLTCNAWDRDRLAWTGPDKKMTISCLDGSGKEVSTDLNAEVAGDAGRYIIRDFVPTGDALRIKMPFLKDSEYKQWLWIENHQTIKRNGSAFDKFQYQEAECVEDATPGLYCYMQVDKSEKEGSYTYSGYGDYLRPMPADGMYDVLLSDEQQINNCVNGHAYEVFERRQSMQNPFSGNHVMEFPVMDINGDDKIDGQEQKALVIERVDGQIVKRLPYLGNADAAFSSTGKLRIGIDTNPTTASMQTLVSSTAALRKKYDRNRNTFVNNTRIKLNGVAVSIVEQRTDGSVVVDITFDDFNIRQNVRWCADTIELPESKQLNILKGTTLLLDQSLTATRLNSPVMLNGKKVFSSPTQMIISKGATLKLEPGSSMVLINGSDLVVEPGGRLIIDSKAKVIVDSGCTITLMSGAKLIVEKNAKIEFAQKSDLIYEEESAVEKKKCGKIKFGR